MKILLTAALFVSNFTFAVASSEVKDTNDYLQCLGTRSWTESGPLEPYPRKNHWIRIKIERHGFGRETLHAFSKNAGGWDNEPWGSAKVQYNHSRDGVWYVIENRKSQYFFGNNGRHMPSDLVFHRPWNNEFIRQYSQRIPLALKHPSENDEWGPTYGFQAWEYTCDRIDPFDDDG